MPVVAAPPVQDEVAATMSRLCHQASADARSVLCKRRRQEPAEGRRTLGLMPMAARAFCLPMDSYALSASTAASSPQMNASAAIRGAYVGW